MRAGSNIWVNFTYVQDAPEKPKHICNVDGCDRPRVAMNEKYLRPQCHEHYKELQRTRARDRFGWNERNKKVIELQARVDALTKQTKEKVK